MTALKSNNMKRKKKFHPDVLFGLILFTAHLSAFAQQTVSIEMNKKLVDSVLTSENLVALNGNPQTFYSAGFEVRAKTVQRLISGCIDFYETTFPGEKFSVHLYLLSEADWKKPHFGPRLPYGMPFYDPDYDIMVVPAEKDALAKLTGLKNIPKTPDSILTGMDYQPLHELGHYFFFTVNKINKEKWFNEFLATYFLICYVKEKNLNTDLQNILKPDYSVAQHRTLEDFQKLYLGVGPANYGWYQCQFAQLGFSIYPQLKTELIKAVLDNYSPGGKNLDGVSLLKNLAPETMDKWLKEMQ